MEIIQKLGINATVFFQLGIFILAFLFLKQLVFNNYIKAFEEREKRTRGGEELADELSKQTEDLHSSFEVKAQEINKKINSIFAEQQLAADREFDQIVTKAKVDSSQMIEINRKKLNEELRVEGEKLKGEVAEFSKLITNKLLKN